MSVTMTEWSDEGEKILVKIEPDLDLGTTLTDNSDGKDRRGAFVKIEWNDGNEEIHIKAESDYENYHPEEDVEEAIAAKFQEKCEDEIGSAEMVAGSEGKQHQGLANEDESNSAGIDGKQQQDLANKDDETSLVKVELTDDTSNDHELRSNVKVFSCDSCEYCCSNMRDLRVHKHRHDGVKPFKCIVCDYRCTTSSDLNRHHRHKHGGAKKSKLHKCELCGIKSCSAFDLKVHKYTHFNIKPYECDLCDFKSASSSNLKKHKYRHSGIKPFECDVCGYKCVKSSDLKRHKYTHSGEKPFECNSCGYKGTTSFSLKNHKCKHSLLHKLLSK